MFESQPLKKKTHWNVLSQSVCCFCWGLDLNREIPERTQFKHVTFSPNYGLRSYFSVKCLPGPHHQKAGGLHPRRLTAGTSRGVFQPPLSGGNQTGKIFLRGTLQVMEPACCLSPCFISSPAI